MLLTSDGKFTGAVSGGCVEKEIWRQSMDVFDSGLPRLMTYDGRYRLGCEGILYILIEPFKPSEQFLAEFERVVRKRVSIGFRICFNRSSGDPQQMGSEFGWEGKWSSVREGFRFSEDLENLQVVMDPCPKLLIIGAEHDAVQLCSYAAMTGWEVTIVAGPNEEKTLEDFPGAQDLLSTSADDFNDLIIDRQTAVMLMTHSFVKDLSFLLAIANSKPFYLGMLGPSDRREKILGELTERSPDVDLAFVENIYGPAGLDLGAETPQEIAISIMSEILSTLRRSDPIPLRDKLGAIHKS